MRTVFALLLLFTQPVVAADCLQIVNSPSPPQLVLRGVIELKRATPSRGIETFLRLSRPVCVQGAARDGRPFKKERVDLIQLDAPINLLRALQTRHRVTLRGELWGPMDNGGPPDGFLFAVREPNVIPIEIKLDGTCYSGKIHAPCGEIGQKLREAGIPAGTFVRFAGDRSVGWDLARDTLGSIQRAGFKIGYVNVAPTE